MQLSHLLRGEPDPACFRIELFNRVFSIDQNKTITRPPHALQRAKILI